MAALVSVSTFLQGKIQHLILKDMMSATDEATPPAYKGVGRAILRGSLENGRQPVQCGRSSCSRGASPSGGNGIKKPARS